MAFLCVCVCVWQGDTAASSSLAHMYIHGLGVPVDYERAHALLTAGITVNEAAAMNSKGYL